MGMERGLMVWLCDGWLIVVLRKKEERITVVNGSGFESLVLCICVVKYLWLWIMGFRCP